MTRERLVWLLTALALAVGAWWLSVNTKWADDERPRPAQGEARDNPVYATEQLLRRLGMQAEHRDSLAALPPEGARLLLLSMDWQLMPGKADQLHQWVQRGGHLVLPELESWEETPLKRWVAVDEIYVSGADKRESPRSPLKAVARAALARTQLASTPPLWGDTDRLTSCRAFQQEWILRAKPGQAVSWSLTPVDGSRAIQDVLAKQNQALRALKQEAGAAAAAEPAPAPSTGPSRSAQALRMPVGKGSVTVLNTHDRVFHNASVLDCEHPLLLAAALQAEPGATAWIYLHEKREALLPWLWHKGWIAIVTGLLALAAALWRAAVRFGPRAAAAPRLRRSISEQVRGLAAYLQAGGREALLAAQQRALHEVATRTLPGYARLPAAERARAIATVSGLASNEIYAALAARFCTRADLLRHLPLLEAARRRLHPSSDERHPP